MPFSRSYRTYRRNRRKTISSGGIRKAFRGRRMRRPMTTGRVKRIIDAELKVQDLSVGPVPIPSLVGSVVHITPIPVGDQNDERTGNWVKPVTWMGTITVQGNEAALPNVVPNFRIGCFVWKENQSLNAPDIAKIMQEASDPHQQYNVENKGQFKILWSRTGILSNQDTNPQYLKVFRFYVRPSMKLLYDNAVFKNNQLFIFAFSDVPAADNPPTYGFATRVRYTDS